MALNNIKNKLKNQIGNLENSFNNAGKSPQQPMQNQESSYNTQYQMQDPYQAQPNQTNNYNQQDNGQQYQQYNNPQQNTQQYNQQSYNMNQVKNQGYTQRSLQSRNPQTNTPNFTESQQSNNNQFNDSRNQRTTVPPNQTQTLHKQYQQSNQESINPAQNTDNTSQTTNQASQDSDNLIVPDTYNAYQQKYNQAHEKKGFFEKLKDKFQNIGTSNQIDTSGVDKFNNSIIDELGYKRLTNDRHHYLVLATPYHATRGYAEMLQIGGASLTNLPPNLADGIMIHFIHFLRAYMADMTFVSIHLPNDSKSQQHYWSGEKRDINYKILRGGLSYHQQEYLLARRKFINAKLKRFQDIDLSVDNQAFVMILFAKTEDELNRDVQYALAFDREGADVLKLSFMSVSQKETFLTRLNNPNISAR